MKFGCSNCFSSKLQIGYVEVRISRSVLEGPFDFEITRVDCIRKRGVKFVLVTGRSYIILVLVKLLTKCTLFAIVFL